MEGTLPSTKPNHAEAVEAGVEDTEEEAEATTEVEEAEDMVAVKEAMEAAAVRVYLGMVEDMATVTVVDMAAVEDMAAVVDMEVDAEMVDMVMVGLVTQEEAERLMGAGGFRVVGLVFKWALLCVSNFGAIWLFCNSLGSLAFDRCLCDIKIWNEVYYLLFRL
ncbi:hypothetical protein V6Z11_D12G029700 [Gossypium hirsutum]